MPQDIYSKAGADAATSAAINALELGTAAVADATDFETAGAAAALAATLGTAAQHAHGDYAPAAQGTFPVQRVTLTSDYAVTTTGWPTDRVVTIVFTQTGTGYAVTYLGSPVSIRRTNATRVDWTWDGVGWAWRTQGAMSLPADTGSPLGVLPAPLGATYFDAAGTNGAYQWLKVQDGGLSTGWRCTFGHTPWMDLVKWRADGTYEYSELGTLSSSFAPLSGQTGAICYRRSGPNVEWWIRSIQANASLTANTIVDLFQPVPLLPVGIWADDGTWPIKALNATHGLVMQATGIPTVTLTLKLRLGASYTTGANIFSTDGGVVSTLLTRDDVWPTSLPGIVHTGTPTPT